MIIKLKILTFVVSLFLALNLYSQTGLGALSVTTFMNETNDLIDNIELDSTLVQIINKKYSLDSTIWVYKGVKNRISLRPGEYHIICTLSDKTIDLFNVPINADRITFLDLLIEPDKKLSFIEKKKRRKRYYNYKMKDAYNTK